MKRKVLAIVLVVTFVLILVNNSCKKSSRNDANNSPNNAFAATPTAQASYDNQSGGVYKGTLTGSSGYFEVNLQAAKPYLIYQWTNPGSNIDSLFANSLGSWHSGQTLSKAVFKGRDGSFFWFSVRGDGSNPVVDSVYIPSHNGRVYAAIAKELSNSLIRIYQGTGTPVSSNNGNCVLGTVNFWVSRGSAVGTYLALTGETGAFNGSVVGNTITVIPVNNNSEGGTLTISEDGNSFSGTVSGNTCSHTVSLTRIF